VQVVDAADSIGYDTHDADDALQLGLIDADELLAVPLWRESVRRVRARWTDLDADALRRAVVHELIDGQVGDLLRGACRRLDDQGIDGVEAVRRAELIVRPSRELAERKVELERFLFDHVYRHPEVIATRHAAQGWLRRMFERYSSCPTLLPAWFLAHGEQAGRARAAGDYLAGMTDRYARQQYEQLFPDEKNGGREEVSC
jgi:dGTPase